LRQQLKRLENCAHWDDGRLTMKSQLIAIVAAVLVVGCGPKAPDISIHEAIFDGNIEAVKQHLAAGTDVNAKDKSGRTPLYSAVEEGRKKMVELLIARGANVNAKSKYGTPLAWAIQMNRTFGDAHPSGDEIVAILRKHGAK
jgi:ankyrin repeat protein